MAKVTYASLKLKRNSEVNILKYNDKEIEVLQYLPIEDKYSLVMVALQNAYRDGIYNDIMLEQMFNLNIIYMYTNITFTDAQRANEAKLYDELESNGLIADVIASIPEHEYLALLDYLKNVRQCLTDYKMSVNATLQSFVENLPENAAAAAEIVDNFDPEKYKAVVDFAKAANGGRDINTNEEVTE